MSDSIFDTIKSHPMEASVIIGGATLLGFCMALLLWQYRQKRVSSIGLGVLPQAPTPKAKVLALLLDCTPSSFPAVLCSIIESYATLELNTKRAEIKKILEKYKKHLECASGMERNTTSSGGGHGIRIWTYKIILEAFAEDRFYETMKKMCCAKEDAKKNTITVCNSVLTSIWKWHMFQGRRGDVSTYLISTNYEEQGEIEYLRTLFLKEQYWADCASTGGRALFLWPNANYNSMLPPEFIDDLTSVLEGNGLSSDYEEISEPPAAQDHRTRHSSPFQRG